MTKPIPSRCAACLLAAAAGAWLLASIPAAPAATEAGKSIDRYRLLTDRNIFVRDRRVYRPPAAYTRHTPAPRDPDSGIVLTGVAVSADRYVAFFENAGGSTSRIGVGEAIGKGKVKAVTLNEVQYERDGVVRTVAVGHSLLGSARVWPAPARPTSAPAPPAPEAGGEVASADAATTAPATAPAETPATPSAAGPSSDSGDVNIADLIERMRRRRERELSR